MSATSRPLDDPGNGPAGGACPFQGCCALCDRLKLTAPGLLAHYHSEYCTTDFQACARYIVARKSGAAAVHPQMLPTDLEKAMQQQRDSLAPEPTGLPGTAQPTAGP